MMCEGQYPEDGPKQPLWVVCAGEGRMNLAGAQERLFLPRRLKCRRGCSRWWLDPGRGGGRLEWPQECGPKGLYTGFQFAPECVLGQSGTCAVRPEHVCVRARVCWTVAGRWGREGKRRGTSWALLEALPVYLCPPARKQTTRRRTGAPAGPGQPLPGCGSGLAGPHAMTGEGHL